MTTPLKALRLAHAALMIGVLAHSNIASAQDEIRPGESVQGEFTAKARKDEYTVNMRPREHLLVHIQSVGMNLFTTFRVRDPGGTIIEHDYSRKLEHNLRSKELSARGAYLIEVWNIGGVGEYIISVGKIDPKGKEILPGSRGPEGPKGSEGSREP